MMKVSTANDFCPLWDSWEHGRAEGLSMAIEMVEKEMCQRGSLAALYDSLVDAQLLLNAKQRR